MSTTGMPVRTDAREFALSTFCWLYKRLSETAVRKSTEGLLSTANGGSLHSRYLHNVSNVSCVPVQMAATTHANRQSH
eukprot:3473174-Pleurochrysis_carterae.AAC.2